MNWKLGTVGVALFSAGAYLAWSLGAAGSAAVVGQGAVAPANSAPQARAADGTTAAAVANLSPTPSVATPPPTQAQAAAMSHSAEAALAAFNQLGSLPPGDAPIALGRQLEAGITPSNAAGYVQALLHTHSPAVERAAMAALARTADSAMVQQLASAYGTLPAERRGRILQVLEAASNPEALQGLVGLAAADPGEKRSPVVVSAMAGIANIGDMDSVSYLLSQVTPANGDYALMALKRVKSAQGLEMIRAAAAGSKDADNIPADYLPVLLRIATAAGK